MRKTWFSLERRAVLSVCVLLYYSSAWGQQSSRATPSKTSVAAPACSTPPPPTRDQYASVEYDAFIPQNHIGGPSTCLYIPANESVQKLYLGDRDLVTEGDTQRILQNDNFNLQASPSYENTNGYDPFTGYTWNFGQGSPYQGGDKEISTVSGDYDGIPNDCHLYNATAQQSTDGIYHDWTTSAPNTAQVRYYGSISNPLEPAIDSIQWDVTVNISESDPANKLANVNGNVTCYPSHEVLVNNQIVAHYDAPQNPAITTVFTCLTESPTTPLYTTNPVHFQ